jgi:hypothetical protein
MKSSTKILLTAATAILAWLLMFSFIGGKYRLTGDPTMRETIPAAATSEPTEEPTEEPTTVVTEPPHHWETGYISTLNLEAEYSDGAGTVLGTLLRGTRVEYEPAEDGRMTILLDGQIVYLPDGEASIVSDAADVIPEHTLYVRTAVNLRDAEGRLLSAFAEKGMAVEVTGCNRLLEDGGVHMYRVRLGEDEGYILPWYLTTTEEEALANFDSGSYAIHAARQNQYGGGDAASLDYFPREKGEIPGNEMPGECRTLYLVNWRLSEVDAYLQLAADSGINAFVVDITDGGSIGNAGEVMKQNTPSAAAAAQNTLEDYQAAIRKIKDAGYYVIGRITTFHDSNFAQDHPEYAITDTAGNLLKIAGGYWPSPFSREAWQYKVDLAVEAVELMGFNEIQFDYVRFPDNTRRYEKNGTIDFKNAYGETKAQAIQRFLMYAADILHEHGAYVSADVYGESAYTYVTAYGQYWSAISNVVDVISGMPYPDHFGAVGSWLPWEHPYDTLYSWGQNVMLRQGETETPAAVRTWIQAYNAIRKPYTVYGPEEVSAQIQALRNTGCTGGYMTWNAGSSLDKYRSLLPAFAPPAGE